MMFFVLFLFSPYPTSVRAVGESFTLSVQPGWIVEGSPNGVSSILSVSNAQFTPPTIYTFNWTVTDPSGKSTSLTNTTLSTSSSWSQLTHYPGTFPSSSLNLVGNYSINVAEVLPSANASIARTRFETGLTNSPAYSRTAVVTVTGTGYAPSDSVIINLVQGTTSVTGFPVSKTAFSTGLVSLSWLTFPNTTLGIYNVSMTGTLTPPKRPRDTQLFSLYPTNMTVNSIRTVPGAVSRSQSTQFTFNATYLNGVLLTSGAGSLQIVEPGGLMSHTVSVAYNNSQQAFNAYYPTNLSSPTGVWAAIISQKALNDGYGNTGPLSPVTSYFTVQTAPLTIYIQPYASTLSAGSTVGISSKVVTPGGQDFTQGTVIAKITDGTLTIAGNIPLTYDQTQGRWTGNYKVGQSDPSGNWLITITAQDGYGNMGQYSTSLSVSTISPPGPQPSVWATWVWLIPVLGAVLVGFGILIFRLRKGIHREVKLDLQAIHRKAEEVKGDSFLLSIQDQLKRRMDRMAEEKEKEKHD